MTRDRRIDARPSAPVRAPGAVRRPASGGPTRRVTPLRVFLFLALVGAVAFALYAVTVRDELQVPLLASSAAVLGLVLGAWAVTAALATLRAAREDRGGRALAYAIGGGLVAMAAFGSFSAALIFGMLWRAPA